VVDGGMSLQLARLLKQAGQAAPESKPVLEVNPDHPLVKKLDGSVHFNDLAQICSTRPCWPRAACPKTRLPMCQACERAAGRSEHGLALRGALKKKSPQNGAGLCGCFCV
jgi:hypothetical protein